MKILLLAFAQTIILFSSFGQARDSIRFQITPDLHFRKITLYEEGQSIFNYRGWVFPLSLSIRKIGKQKGFDELELGYDKTKLTNTRTQTRIQATNAKIRYSHYWKTRFFHKADVNTYIGATLKNQLQVREYTFSQTAFDEFSGEAFSSLALDFLINKQFDNAYLQLESSVSVITFLASRRYNPNENSFSGDDLWVTLMPPGFTDSGMMLEYGLPVGKKSFFILQYGWNFYAYERAFPVCVLNHELNLGLRIGI